MSIRDCSRILKLLDSVHTFLDVSRRFVRVHVLSYDEWRDFMDCEHGHHTCGPYEPRPSTVMQILHDIAMLRQAHMFARIFECRAEGAYLLVTKMGGRYIIVEVDTELIDPEQLFTQFVKFLTRLIDAMRRSSLPHDEVSNERSNHSNKVTELK